MPAHNFDLDSYLDSQSTDPDGFDLDSYLDSKPTDPDVFDLDTYIDAKREPQRFNPFRAVGRAASRFVGEHHRTAAGIPAAAAGALRGLRGAVSTAWGEPSYIDEGPMAARLAEDDSPLERRLRGISEAEFARVDEADIRAAETSQGGYDVAADVTGSLLGIGAQYVGAGAAGRRLTGMATRPKPGFMGAAKDVAADVGFAAPLDIATTQRAEDSSANMVEMFADPERYPEMMANPEGVMQNLTALALPALHAVASKANETPAGRALFESVTGGVFDAALRGGIAGVRGQARYLKGLDERGGAGVQLPVDERGASELFRGVEGLDEQGLAVFAKETSPGIRNVVSLTPNPKPEGGWKATIFEEVEDGGHTLLNTSDFASQEEGLTALRGGHRFFEGYTEIPIGPAEDMERAFRGATDVADTSRLGGAPPGVVGAVARVGGGALVGGAADASIGLDSSSAGKARRCA